MTTFDGLANLVATTVNSAPVPALTGTSLGIVTGPTLPPAPFNAFVFPAIASPIFSNCEIVRVEEDKGGGSLKIKRVAEPGGVARAISIGDRFWAGVTKKTLDDIQKAIVVAESAITSEVTRAILEEKRIEELIPAPGGGGEITVYDQTGTPLTKRSALEVHGIVAVDDAISKRTILTTRKQFVDFNDFKNLKEERVGIRASEAGSRDAGPVIREAIMKAAIGGVGMVSCSEPATYQIESMATIPEMYEASGQAPPSAGTFFGTVGPPWNNGVGLRFGVPVIGGVVFWAPSPKYKLEIKGKALEERQETPGQSCILVGVDGGRFKYEGWELVCKALPKQERKEPPNLPDGILQCGGMIQNVSIQSTGGFRYGYIPSGNHIKLINADLGGWARMGVTKWGKPTGNEEYIDVGFDGGGCNVYFDEQGLEGAHFVRGFYGTCPLPLFFKPVSGGSSVFMIGVTFLEPQIEGGSRGLFYNTDGLSDIVNVRIVNPQLGGPDAPLKEITKGDLTVPVDAFIKCRKFNEVTVVGNGAVLVSTGWGENGTCVWATEQAVGNRLGDVSEAYLAAVGRNQPIFRSPEQEDNTGTLNVEDSCKTTHTVGFRIANSPVRQGQLVQPAGAPSSPPNWVAKKEYSIGEQVVNPGDGWWYACNTPIAVGSESTFNPIHWDQLVVGKFRAIPYSEAGAQAIGICMQSVGTGHAFLYTAFNPARPAHANIRISGGGGGENASENFPPLARGGVTTVGPTAPFLFGSGEGGAHAAPMLLFGIKPYDDVAYVSTLSDLVAPGIASVAGVPISWQKMIAKGTETTVINAEVKNKSKEIKLKEGDTKGLAPGVRLFGTGMPGATSGAEITQVDQLNFIVWIGALATSTGTYTLTAIAPQNTLVGVLIGTSTRITASINVATLTGTQTVKVEDTTGFPETGGVFEFETTTIAYKEIVGNEFRNCTYLEGTKTTYGSGAVITEAQPASIGPKGKLARMMEVATLTGVPASYTGPDITMKQGINLAVSNAGYKLPKGGGRALVGIKTKLILAPGVKILKAATEIKVESTEGFYNPPLAFVSEHAYVKGDRVSNGTKVYELPGATYKKPTFVEGEWTLLVGLTITGKVLLGSLPNLNFTYTHLHEDKQTFLGVKIPNTGTQAKLNALSNGSPVTGPEETQIYYEEATETEIKNITEITESKFPTGHGANITHVNFAPSGGVFGYPEWKAKTKYAPGKLIRYEYQTYKAKGPEFESGETFNPANWEAVGTGTYLQTYGGRTIVRGKQYVVGINTPGGGGSLAVGVEIEDIKVYPLSGNFPPGPNSIAMYKLGNTSQFAYERWVTLAGETLGAEAEREPGEPLPEEVVDVSGSPYGYAVGVSHTIGSTGGYAWSGTLLAKAIKPKTEKPSVVLIESFSGIAGAGVIQIGKWTASYLSGYFGTSTKAEVTGEASTGIFTKTAHGYTNGTKVTFNSFTAGKGITPNIRYFVLGATANTFELSKTEGGPPVAFTENLTAGVIGVASPALLKCENWTGSVEIEYGIGTPVFMAPLAQVSAGDRIRTAIAEEGPAAEGREREGTVISGGITVGGRGASVGTAYRSEKGITVEVEV